MCRKVEVPEDWEIVTTSVNAVPAPPEGAVAALELVDALQTAGSFAEFKSRITRDGISR
jgi:hypothetical protein